MEWSYRNLEEVGDSSEEWQGGTRLPIWGVKRLGTELATKTRKALDTEREAGEREKRGTEMTWERKYFCCSPGFGSRKHPWEVLGEGSLKIKAS